MIIDIDVGFSYCLVVNCMIIDLMDDVVVFNLMVRLFYVVLVVIRGVVLVLVYICVELIFGGKVLKFIFFIFLLIFID